MCDSLAARGFVGAAPVAEDENSLETVAAIAGFVAGSGSTTGDRVALLALPASSELAVTLGTQIADLIERVVFVGRDHLHNIDALRSAGVKAEVRPDIDATTLVEASSAAGGVGWEATVAALNA
jgi:hypothetical protein